MRLENDISRTLRLTLLAILLAAACSREDRVISVADDDPEMEAAIAKARDTLPQFWQVFEKPGHAETDFSLKVKITDTFGTEFFWLTDLERTAGKTLGTVNNDPGIVASVKLGDRIEIPQADVSDWLYMRNGKMVGNYTMRVLFKQMPADEVEAYKKLLADP